MLPSIFFFIKEGFWWYFRRVFWALSRSCLKRICNLDRLLRERKRWAFQFVDVTISVTLNHSPFLPKNLSFPWDCFCSVRVLISFLSSYITLNWKPCSCKKTSQIINHLTWNPYFWQNFDMKVARMQKPFAVYVIIYQQLIWQQAEARL